MYPVITHIGPVVLYSYGTMLVVAFAAALLWTTRQAKQRGVSADFAVDMALWMLVGGIVGARAVFVLLDRASYANWMDALRTWQGGLSFHGGLIGALAALGLFAWRRRASFWELTDLASPGAALGYAFARVGCFLNGCCYGVPTKLPWACTFRDPLSPTGVTPPSHPVQLYASLANLAIFAVLVRIASRRPKPGIAFASYLALYSIYRFLAEFLRKGVTARVLVGGFTEAQVASAALFLVAVLLGVVMARRGPQPAAASEPAP
jgi:phosphatidylglycerol:prolipoprotein diacylglycerol transferase